MIPQTSANEKPFSTGPPQMNRAITVRNVKPGSHDGPAQRLVHRAIHHGFQRLLARELQILADTVEDHDGIVHRVADQRQQRRDHRHGDLFIEQGEQSDGDQRIVEARDYRA